MTSMALAVSGIVLTGCAATGSHASKASYPEAKLYDAEVDAGAQLDAALARAAAMGKHTLLVMGANWCHDSRAFAGWSQTPRFAAMLAENYETVFVDVGIPQNGEGRNLDLPARFGIDELVGTPTVLVIGPDGELKNRDTAGSWRNTASRSEDAIYAELVALANAPTNDPD